METTIEVGIQRLEALTDYMEGIDERRFHFGHFAGRNWQGDANLSCGTTACALGWATTMPLFQELGLRLEMRKYSDGTPISVDLVCVTDTNWSAIRERLFGFGIQYETFVRLFIPREYDEEADDQLPDNASSKEWVAHARKIIEELKANL